MKTSVRVMAIAALAALASSGCSGTFDELAEEGVERLVEEGIEGTSGAEVDLGVDGESAALPSTWPEGAPEPPGRIVASFGQDDGGTVTLEVASGDEVEAYVAMLEDAGFARVSEGEFGVSVVDLSNGAVDMSIGWVGQDGSTIGTITYRATGA